MANDKNFKIKNGILAQRYLQTGGTETAGSEGYNLSSATYDNKSFSVTAQENNAVGLFLSTDGTKMYTCGASGDDINEYSLGTAWDISTASYVRIKLVLANIINPSQVVFSPDGLNMYVIGINPATSNDYLLAQYTLSTAWNVSTASYVRNFAVGSAIVGGWSMAFKDDGTKLYTLTSGNLDLNEYNLSTAWDISTTSFVQAGAFNINTGVFFATGSILFVGLNGNILKYALSTAWDISTATYTGETLTLSGAPYNFYVKSDGTKLYYMDNSNDTIYQYSTVAYSQTLDLSTGTYFSFTPSGATTVSFTNPPASGLALGFALEVVGDGSAITWPASIKWHEATTPTATATKEVYAFITTDGGTTYYGRKAVEDLQ
jgi:hypothetical protein